MNDEYALPHGSDRPGVKKPPPIEVTVRIVFEGPGKQNDDLVGWMASYLQGREEVKSVHYQMVGVSQDNEEVTGGKQQGDTFGPDKENASAGGTAW